MDLVDEQHIALTQLCENRCEVARALERGPRGDVQVHAHLGSDDASHGGLAEARRTRKQEVVDGLVAAAGRLDDDGEMLFEFALADKIAESARTKPNLVAFFDLVVDPWVEEFFTHVSPLTTAAHRATE